MILVVLTVVVFVLTDELDVVVLLELVVVELELELVVGDFEELVEDVLVVLVVFVLIEVFVTFD